MKKMSFTKSNWLMSFGQSLGLVLLFCCFTALQSMQAQTLVGPGGDILTPADSSLAQFKLTECGAIGDGAKFTDDGTNDGLYADPDGKPRKDTVEICPTDAWSRVNVVFTEFDLAPGDTLFAFQGNVTALNDSTLAAAGRAAGVTLAAGTSVDDINAIAAALAEAKDDDEKAKILAAAIKAETLPKGITLAQFEALIDALLAVLAEGVGSLPGTASGAGIGTTSLAQARSGVSDAFGGWIDADCDPGVNGSGCLTFIFQTDGNRVKGTGWEAWVSCEARGAELAKPDDVWGSATCDGDATVAANDAPVASPTIKAASLTGICKDTLPANGNDDVMVEIKDASGSVCLSGIYKAGATLPAQAFAVGTYVITHTLVVDEEKTQTNLMFIASPSLTCNDELNVPLGGGCKVVLNYDDLLEAPCEPNVAVSYSIVIKDASGEVLSSSPASDSLGNVVIDKTMLGDAVCAGTTLTATITRKYDYSKQGGSPVVCETEVLESCEVLINIADETGPIFTRQPQFTFLRGCDFTDEQLATYAGAPTLIDNCSEAIATATVSTSDTTDICDDLQTYFVTWNAIDGCGKAATPLTDTIRIRRPNLNVEIDTVQARKLVRDCSDADGGIDAITNVAANRPGLVRSIWNRDSARYLPIDTLRLSEETYVCNYILTKTEVEVPADCGKKVFVTWKAIDWCEPTAPSTLSTQLIHYTDTDEPTINEEDLVSYEAAQANPISLPHFKCYLDKSPLPTVGAEDNCDDNPEVKMVSVQQKGEGDTWTEIATSLSAAIDAEALVCDTFRVIYEASDICHTQTDVDSDTSYIVVIDNTQPSAVTVDQLNISLPNEWGARVKASDVDAGSYDACGLASIQIRIKDSGDDWADQVDIGCQYVKNGLQIEMRVIDNKGNENIAWCDVNVEDKINPICTAPTDRTADCDQFHNGELGAPTAVWAPVDAALQAKYDAYFGAFTCEDNLKVEECGILTEVQQYKLTEWPCGQMEIERRHKATDWSDNESAWVSQSITIEYNAGWSFTIPADAEGSCKEAPEAASVTITNGACDLLGFEVTNKRFDVPGDACYKIERTYHIINWCAYQAGQDPVELARVEGEHKFVANGRTISFEGNEEVGYFTYVQILKVHDNEAPVVTVVDPTPCISGVDFDAAPYGEEDITPGSGPFECDEEKTWTASATDCSDQSAITWVGQLFDANGNIVKEVNTNSLTYVVSNKESYYAEFWAYDGCGNSGGKKGAILKFWDCKKPTPYVLNGVAVELGETGSIQIWSTDLDRGTFDNCTDQSNLELKIWHEDLGDAPTTLEGVQALPKVITLGCTRVGTQAVQIYAIDEEGNWDYAQTYVIVQDNMGVCTQVNEGGMVAGRIVDGNGENVQSVSIAVNGTDAKSMTTEADGHYQFVLPMGGDYTITPQKGMNPLNGVSTFDLVLISKHILGITQFDTPYKYIAADVNKSGSITAFDMVQLRQLILNITSEFPNNDSWRFVEGGYEFTSANPAAESFNEFMSINNLSADMPNMDFTAVKIGDVNGNALSNSLLGAESRTTNGTLNLNVTDRFVEAGQTVTVAFTAANIANTTGYQFTLTTAGTAEVVEGVAKAANFNTNLAERGVIATSWNGEATANDVLFALTFTANTTGLLSEMLAITSDVTAAEAYNTAGELLNVGIEFNSAATAAGFELNQNTPNPFTDVTTIGFNLPAAGTATLTVMDVQGKVLRSIKADYAKGANQVTLNANELGATGVLYYQLESADNVATKKMIIIE